MRPTPGETDGINALLLLVGPKGEARDGLTNALIARGHSVVICEGPPDCPLARDERCGIVEATDGVVMLPNATADAPQLDCLAKCVGLARRALVIEPSAIAHERPIRHVSSTGAAAIAIPWLLQTPAQPTAASTDR
jgi:hypothetical protein